MATLSNPHFQVDILTGMPDDYWVTATVNVELTPFETRLLNFLQPSVTLNSDLWGSDGGTNGEDDHLFPFTPLNITGSGTYTFTALVPKGKLNEDHSWFDQTDEVYNRFNLVSEANFITAPSVGSPIITGDFG